MKYTALVLYLLGVLIVLGSHIWLLTLKTSMSEKERKYHAYINLLAVAMLVAGWVIQTRM